MPSCDSCGEWLSRDYERVFSKRDGALYCRNCDSNGRMIDRTLRSPGQMRDKV